MFEARLPTRKRHYFFIRRGYIKKGGEFLFQKYLTMNQPPPAFLESSPHFYGFWNSVFEVTIHEPKKDADIPEALVVDLWQTQHFDANSLLTFQGHSIEIISTGEPNINSGPDFLGARVRMDGVLLTGDVEIHTSSGKWEVHRHHFDPRYNSVILHVSLFPDLRSGRLYREDGTALPELILFPLLTRTLRHLAYEFRRRAPGTLACAGNWSDVPTSILMPMVNKLAKERISDKKKRFSQAFMARPDLEELLHESIFAALGYARNTWTMGSLANRLPLKITRQFEDTTDLEALHLGTAGLIPTTDKMNDSDPKTASYITELRNRYIQFAREFNIQKMEPSSWQFFRLRPANFPPLRIAQGVSLLQSLFHQDVMELILDALQSEKPIEQLHLLLRASASSFWSDHVRLEKRSKPRSSIIGRQRSQIIIVNTVIPALLLHADMSNNPDLSNLLFTIIDNLPATSDEITRMFSRLGFSPQNAFVAQGAHQLYRTRCSKGRCLYCPVGRYILDRS